MATEQTLVVFDMDGTLVDGLALDHLAFDLAFEEVLGRPLAEGTWQEFPEITSASILSHVLRDREAAEATRQTGLIINAYLHRLQEGHQLDATALRAFVGARELLASLRQAGFAVAIGTGCWRETALFKLGVAGFDLEGIPFASSSDRLRRTEIINLAAERAGMHVHQALYVGDRPWDLRAARELGIPFVGVGHKTEALRQAGAEHVWDSLDLSGLGSLIEKARGSAKTGT